MTLPASLRGRLLLGILLPVLGFVMLNAVGLYRQALDTANTAYDRSLLASAKSLGELLEVAGEPAAPRLHSTLLYSALEAFEADNRSRMVYRVAGFGGEMIAGFGDLPSPRTGDCAERNPYAALVCFYDDAWRGQPVRMAVLLQPVSGRVGQGMATIQVAETLELRRTLARGLLVQTLAQQALLVLLIAAVVTFAVQRATRPVRALSARLQQRAATDVSPLPAGGAPRELLPIVDATNALLGRMAALLELHKRFVRDASHQLRTPLAVLKAQLQSARRGDVEPAVALAEMSETVERATALANQMLALAKVEQLRQQGGAAVVDWAAASRAVALDLAPLVAAARLEFDIDTAPAPVRGHEWALGELTRNLLHNALRHAPPGSRLAVSLRAVGGAAVLTVSDSGPGIADEQRPHLFQPFAAGSAGGSGLGLAICHEIVAGLGGRIALNNRPAAPPGAAGLDAVVTLPLATDNEGDKAP